MIYFNFIASFDVRPAKFWTSDKTNILSSGNASDQFISSALFQQNNCYHQTPKHSHMLSNVSHF